MRYVFLLCSFLLLLGFNAQSQTAKDSLQLQKADSFFDSGKFKKAENLYQKFAFEFHSNTILYKAALSHENATNESTCTYFKQMIANGYKLSDTELYFYSCDPKTFENIAK